jgi:hypothetical protein
MSNQHDNELNFHAIYLKRSRFDLNNRKLKKSLLYSISFHNNYSERSFVVLSTDFLLLPSQSIRGTMLFSDQRAINFVAAKKWFQRLDWKYQSNAELSEGSEIKTRRNFNVDLLWLVTFSQTRNFSSIFEDQRHEITHFCIQDFMKASQMFIYDSHYWLVVVLARCT